jgi:Uma2 family endonuclease
MASILDNPAFRQVAMHVTVEQYHRLGESGLIPKQTELLQGVIVEKMNESPNHSWLAMSLARWLSQHLPNDMHVRQEQPLTFSDSEPESDIAVVAGDIDAYRYEHPKSALLVVEIAISSAGIDREKARLYAAAGVPQYLIFLPNDEVVEVYAQPKNGEYGVTERFSSKDSLPLSVGLTLELTSVFR